MSYARISLVCFTHEYFCTCLHFYIMIKYTSYLWYNTELIHINCCFYMLKFNISEIKHNLNMSVENRSNVFGEYNSFMDINNIE